MRVPRALRELALAPGAGRSLEEEGGRVVVGALLPLVEVAAGEAELPAGHLAISRGPTAEENATVTHARTSPRLVDPPNSYPPPLPPLRRTGG